MARTRPRRARGDDRSGADAHKRRAAQVSLVGGLGILAVKLGGYWVTSSRSILADALESTANVAAAALLLVSIAFAARPADRNHPYGHGKAELFSAAFEGALIVAAAGLVAIGSVASLWQGAVPQRLDAGLALLALGALGNAALGGYVIAVGRRTGSLALEADGRHLFADVWTSAAVMAGLGLQLATGWTPIDPLLAIAVSGHLVYTGVGLVRRALAGLLDEADEETLERVARTLEDEREAAWVDVHSLRAWRSGDLHHMDLHLVVPRFYTADRLHGLAERLEARTLERAGLDGEIIVHFDPCRPHQCSRCTLADCDIRSAEFSGRTPIGFESAIRADEPIRD